MEALVEKNKPNKNNGVSSIAMFDYTSILLLQCKLAILSSWIAYLSKIGDGL